MKDLPSRDPKDPLGLAALREQYLASAGKYIDAFRDLGERLAEAPDAEPVIKALHATLHRIHGSAGSFGFMEASRLAGQLEARVQGWIKHPALDLEQRAMVIRHFTEALNMIFATAVDLAVARAPAPRRMIVLGGDSRNLTQLRQESPRHGYVVDGCLLGELDAETQHDNGPTILVCEASDLPQVRALSSLSRVPTVVLGVLDPRELRVARWEWPRIAVLDARAPAAAIFEAAAQLTNRNDWAGTTVLVVDDDPSVLAIVRYILEADGIEVITLLDPHAVEATLAARMPSLALVDVFMPGIDGLSLVRQLRSQPVWGDLPIVLFSVSTDAEMRAAAYQAGADDFVAKPIVPAELRGRIMARLEQHRMRRLSAGVHPVTGLSLTSQTVASVTTALHRGGMVRRGGPSGGNTFVLLAPDVVASISASVPWLREAYRIAAVLRPLVGTLGHGDGDTVLAVADGDPAAVERALADLSASRPSNAPSWRAGLVRSNDADASFDQVHDTALRALATARANGAEVLVWGPAQLPGEPSRSSGNSA